MGGLRRVGGVEWSIRIGSIDHEIHSQERDRGRGLLR